MTYAIETDRRVGDADRESVRAYLGKRCSTGHLPVEEYQQRCLLADEAEFSSQLAYLVRDLPDPTPETPATARLQHWLTTPSHALYLTACLLAVVACSAGFAVAATARTGSLGNIAGIAVGCPSLGLLIAGFAAWLIYCSGVYNRNRQRRY